MERNRIIFLLIFALFLFTTICWAEKEDFKIVDSRSSTAATTTNAVINIPAASSIPNVSNLPNTPEPVAPVQVIPPRQPILAKADNNTYYNITNYTLGPDDVIQIDVQRHPEFSGIFPLIWKEKSSLNLLVTLKLPG